MVSTNPEQIQTTRQQIRSLPSLVRLLLFLNPIARNIEHPIFRRLLVYVLPQSVRCDSDR